MNLLAQTYPLPRKKEEVPTYIYVASDLSIRLHGLQSFNSYPLVVRTGGLINALGPEVGRKVRNPETGQVTIHCPGFNKKNEYDRQTPCDQDYLRKIAKDTQADKLLAWYNEQMPQILKEEDLFDEEGIAGSIYQSQAGSNKPAGAEPDEQRKSAGAVATGQQSPCRLYR